MSAQEQRAFTLVSAFCKKTSVVFDMNALVELFKHEDTDEEGKVLIANAMFASLVILRQAVQPSNSLGTNAALIPTYKMYMELSHAALKLDKLNIMI